MLKYCERGCILHTAANIIMFSNASECVGAFGNVRVCWLKGHPSTKYAIKTMKKADIIKSKHVDHIENEKKILERAEHPFIVTFLVLTVCRWATLASCRTIGTSTSSRSCCGEGTSSPTTGRWSTST
jgi:serine/threonine protein kinase